MSYNSSSFSSSESYPGTYMNACESEKLKLEADISRLQSANDSLNNDKRAMQIEIDKLKNDNKSLQIEIDKLKNDNKSLKSEIDRLNNELKNKKVSEVAPTGDSCNKNSLLYYIASFAAGYFIRK